MEKQNHTWIILILIMIITILAVGCLLMWKVYLNMRDQPGLQQPITTNPPALQTDPTQSQPSSSPTQGQTDPQPTDPDPTQTPTAPPQQTPTDPPATEPDTTNPDPEACQHSFDIWQTVQEPTCLSTGVQERVCTVCAHVEREELPVSDHRFGDWIAEPVATCTEDGILTRTCPDCAYSETQVVAATGHSFGDWYVHTEVTCTADGILQRNCQNCALFESQTVAATGHSFGEWYIEKDPTCTEEGILQRQCPGCGECEQIPLETKAHNYSEWITLEQPTCTKEGILQRKCQTCADVQKKKVDPTGHTFGSWETTKEVTCTTDGIQLRRCQNCSESEERTIGATGHDYDDGVVVEEPASCTDWGICRYSCRNCTASSDIAIKGQHDLVHVVSGYCYWKCSYCQITFEDFYSNVEADYGELDYSCAMATDKVTLKESVYSGKLATWPEEWFEYRTIIYHCMMGRSESYHYGSGPEYPYEHPIGRDATKEQAEALRDDFALFLDGFQEVFGWRPDDPTVEYSNHYKGYCLFFDIKEMYNDYKSQIRKLSEEERDAICRDVTAYLVHEWGIYEGMSVYDASCLISESIWGWTYYDWSLRTHDAIDGFGLFSCVCDGYAKMFQYFAEYCGINAEIVHGKHMGVGHAWNMVTFSDGTVRYIDLTNSSVLKPDYEMTDYVW